MKTNKIKSKHLHSFLRDPSAIIGTLLLLAFIFIAIFAPLLAPMDPYDLKNIDLGNYLLTPAWIESGSIQFPLGTDDQGRVIFSTRLLHVFVVTFENAAGNCPLKLFIVKSQ